MIPIASPGPSGPGSIAAEVGAPEVGAPEVGSPGPSGPGSIAAPSRRRPSTTTFSSPGPSGPGSIAATPCTCAAPRGPHGPPALRGRAPLRRCQWAISSSIYPVPRPFGAGLHCGLSSVNVAVPGSKSPGPSGPGSIAAVGLVPLAGRWRPGPPALRGRAPLRRANGRSVPRFIRWRPPALRGRAPLRRWGRPRRSSRPVGVPRPFGAGLHCGVHKGGSYLLDGGSPGPSGPGSIAAAAGGGGLVAGGMGSPGPSGPGSIAASRRAGPRRSALRWSPGPSGPGSIAAGRSMVGSSTSWNVPRPFGAGLHCGGCFGGTCPYDPIGPPALRGRAPLRRRRRRACTCAGRACPPALRGRAPLRQDVGAVMAVIDAAGPPALRGRAPLRRRLPAAVVCS